MTIIKILIINTYMIKKIALTLSLAFVMLTLSACSIAWPWQSNEEVLNEERVDVSVDTSVDTSIDKVDEPYSQGLNKFQDYNELKEYIDRHYANVSSDDNYSVPDGLDSGLSGTMGSMSDSRSINKTSYYNSSLESNDYSATNVQVQGVDEADVIKTDGNYIYAISYHNLYIIDAVPADTAEIIANVNFEHRPKEMYIKDNKLVVLGMVEDGNNINNFEIDTEHTFVYIFDTSDIEGPVKIKEYYFEGEYLSSRSVEGIMYLVLNQAVKTDSSENLLPTLIEDGIVLSNDCSVDEKCFAPDVYYSDDSYYYHNSHKFTSITSIDFNDEGSVLSSQLFFLKSGSIVYSSLNNLYVTNTAELDLDEIIIKKIIEYIKPMVSQEDKLVLERIESAKWGDVSDEDFFLFFDVLHSVQSDFDPENSEMNLERLYIGAVIEENDNLIRTIIYKFSLNDGYINFEKSGSVPGFISNQFFLDEDEYENLRIVTAQESFVDEGEGFESIFMQSFSNLFVLSPDLQILNSVRGLAKNEDVYSVRFLGNRAYIVTFEKIDPLFVIDLSDPVKPVLMGELKIPGYSTYLHPYDENTLIGFGRDTYLEDFWVVDAGLKLSLFDVQDPTTPQELDHIIIGDERSDSMALYNHKAFLFDKEKNLLVVPAFLSAYLDNGSSMGGAIVLSIDDNKFKLRGHIDHSDNGLSSDRDMFCGESCYDNSVQRSLYINDVVYTLSNKYLKANSIIDLSNLSTMSFER